MVDMVANIEDVVNNDKEVEFESHDSMADIVYILRRLVTEEETVDKLCSTWPTIPALLIQRCL